ncbi:unnamed protein product, partial [marine sediment metagenome]
ALTERQVTVIRKIIMIVNEILAFMIYNPL